jgi:hypothetical protein
MTIKIYSDRIDIGDFTLFEGNGGLQFDGVARAENFKGGAGTFQGSVSGYASGGRGGPPPVSSQNTIDKFPFATNSNATDVGDLTAARSENTGNSSQTSGYASASNNVNTIQKFPFATDTNATSTTNLLNSYSGGAQGQSSSTHGYVSGGSVTSLGTVNTIQKFTFATDTNATDVGDTTILHFQGSGQSSFVSGYITGGFDGPDIIPNLLNTIDKFPFATDSNVTDVGDITVVRRGQAGQSSTVSGYTTSGFRGPPENVRVNSIEKFPFSTDTNATDIGDLTRLVAFSAGQSSTVSGYTSGGEPGSPQPQNNIDKFPFVTDTNATDVGDLTQGRYSLAGNQV